MDDFQELYELYICIKFLCKLHIWRFYELDVASNTRFSWKTDIEISSLKLRFIISSIVSSVAAEQKEKRGKFSALRDYSLKWKSYVIHIYQCRNKNPWHDIRISSRKKVGILSKQCWVHRSNQRRKSVSPGYIYTWPEWHINSKVTELFCENWKC